MKEIQLTQGKVALVDDEDFEELNQYKWYAVRIKKLFYAVRSSGNRHIYMHHHLIGKPPKGLVTDHNDSNGLNNQRYNLRFITYRENSYYKNIDMTSSYPGVSWKKQNKKWEARIRIDGRYRYLGYFTDEKEAAQAYQDALKEYEENVSFPTLLEFDEDINKLTMFIKKGIRI